mmetsp:Transcript_28572/g.35353  ORF Transcript_28572/g.35353 Transcript_28572/m.35353 type:complete len:145 (-) Transcript_28572:1866-2300(-)
MILYIVLPFFEKPGWCLLNTEIDRDTTKGYWFCNNERGTIANSRIIKLPANVTNIAYILCLVTLAYYTKARDYYRRRDDKGDTVTLQMWLIWIAVLNLILTEVVINVVDLNSRNDNFFYQFSTYAYINALMRPILFVLSIRSVK